MGILSRLKKRDRLLMTITPLDCTLSWIDQHNKRLLLKAHTTQSWTNSECEKGMIFNPTSIKRLVNQFIKNHKIQNPSLACAVQGPLIFEKMNSVLSREHASQGTSHWNWHSLYLCSYNEEPLYYSAGIPQTILLQYKLLSIGMRMPLSLLTTQTISLLKAYQHIKGATFRTAQLSSDLQQSNGLFEQLVDVSLVPRIMSIPSSLTISPDQYPSLLIATGLYLLDGEP